MIFQHCQAVEPTTGLKMIIIENTNDLEKLKELVYEAVKQANIDSKKCECSVLPEKQVINNSDNTELMTLPDVCRYLQKSRVTIHKWKKTGILPFYRMSNKIYFKRAEVDSALIKAKNSKVNL